jgi:NAD(P)-dependent dehydrogenase (short-subunit alcohol dehydrogenase family)
VLVNAPVHVIEGVSVGGRGGDRGDRREQSESEPPPYRHRAMVAASKDGHAAEAAGSVAATGTSSHEQMSLTSLTDRVVAVAGAGGNLGPTVVRRLAAAGARQCLCGRDVSSLDALAAEVDGDVETAAVDLLDPAATKAWADDVAARNERVDGLVHLVGGWRGGKPIEEAPLEDWDALETLLIRTVQNATQAFTSHLLASGHGRFVLISAGQAQTPTSPNAAYAAAKAAAETWTLALADRFRGTGATANIVVVGSIVTPEMRTESPDKDFSKATPAEEIAEAIAYVCSDAAASMNGQRLTLRGAA